MDGQAELTWGYYNGYLVKVIKVKAVCSSSCELTSELPSVTCHMGSHSVTCHSTQVNAPRLIHSQAGQYSIYSPQRDGRLSWSWWLVICRDGFAVHRQSSSSSWREDSWGPLRRLSMMTVILCLLPLPSDTPQTVTHSNSKHLIATRPGVEPTTCWSWVRCPAITLPSYFVLSSPASVIWLSVSLLRLLDYQSLKICGRKKVISSKQMVYAEPLA